MDINTIISVAVVAQGANPTQPDTDTLAVAAYHTHYSDLFRIYDSLAGMVTDGFTETEPAYLEAKAQFSQNPTLAEIVVIRLTTPVIQALQFTVGTVTIGVPMGFSILDNAGNVTEVFHTPTSGQTAAQVATALAAIGVTGAVLTTPGSTNVVLLTVGTAGQTWYADDATGGALLDQTPTASIAADLTAAYSANNSWYGVGIQYRDATNIAAAAAWVLSNGVHLASFTTGDTIALTSGQGIGNTLKGLANSRAVIHFNGASLEGDIGVGLMAQRFTDDAGSDSWAYKTVAGCAPDPLTPTQIAGAAANNLNIYTVTDGVNATYSGVTASGMFADVRRGIDALVRQIQLNIFGLLVTIKKIPGTIKGQSMVKAEIKAALQQFVDDGFLSDDPGSQFVVNMPRLSSIPQNQRAARILSGITFTAVGANAFQTFQIQGSVN